MGAYDRAADAKRDKATKGKGTSKGTTEKSYNAEFKGFVNVELSETDKATFGKWSEQVDFWQVVQFFIDDGNVFSLKVDQRSGGYSAAATQRRDDSVNAGLCINMRAGTAVKALMRLVFVLSTVVGENWALYAAGEADDDW